MKRIVTALACASALGGAIALAPLPAMALAGCDYNIDVDP